MGVFVDDQTLEALEEALKILGVHQTGFKPETRRSSAEHFG
jgi:hypothetical protein